MVSDRVKAGTADFEAGETHERRDDIFFDDQARAETFWSGDLNRFRLLRPVAAYGW